MVIGESVHPISDARPSPDQADRGIDVTSQRDEFMAVAKGVTLTEWAAILAREPEIAGRVVENQTGTRGQYDFTFRWTRLNPASNHETPQADALDATWPPLFPVLEEELGLRLESTKSRVDTIRIDHIEEPSPN